MYNHLVLLRGINVSGQKLIKMEELRNHLTDNGFQNVQTYIQSGNVFVTTAEADPNVVEQQVAALLLDKYGFQVTVVAISEAGLKKVFMNNPFLADAAIGLKQLYVAFLSEVPQQENVGKLDASFVHPDTFTMGDRALYLCYHNNAGNSKMTNNWIENRLKVTATSRNWNTVTKLVALFEARKG